MRHAKPKKTEYNKTMKRKKNTYSAGFRLLGGQYTPNELAAKYQVAPATLSSWQKQF